MKGFLHSEVNNEVTPSEIGIEDKLSKILQDAKDYSKVQSHSKSLEFIGSGDVCSLKRQCNQLIFSNKQKEVELETLMMRKLQLDNELSVKTSMLLTPSIPVEHQERMADYKGKMQEELFEGEKLNMMITHLRAKNVDLQSRIRKIRDNQEFRNQQQALLNQLKRKADNEFMNSKHAVNESEKQIKLENERKKAKLLSLQKKRGALETHIKKASMQLADALQGSESSTAKHEALLIEFSHVYEDIVSNRALSSKMNEKIRDYEDSYVELTTLINSSECISAHIDPNADFGAQNLIVVWNQYNDIANYMRERFSVLVRTQSNLSGELKRVDQELLTLRGNSDLGEILDSTRKKLDALVKRNGELLMGLTQFMRDSSERMNLPTLHSLYEDLAVDLYYTIKGIYNKLLHGLDSVKDKSDISPQLLNEFISDKNTEEVAKKAEIKRILSTTQQKIHQLLKNIIVNSVWVVTFISEDSLVDYVNNIQDKPSPDQIEILFESTSSNANSKIENLLTKLRTLLDTVRKHTEPLESIPSRTAAFSECKKPQKDKATRQSQKQVQKIRFNIIPVKSQRDLPSDMLSEKPRSLSNSDYPGYLPPSKSLVQLPPIQRYTGKVDEFKEIDSRINGLKRTALTVVSEQKKHPRPRTLSVTKRAQGENIFKAGKVSVLITSSRKLLNK